MGIRKEAVYLLMQEGLRRSFQGRIITLGRQDIAVTYEEILEIAQKTGYPVRALPKVELSDKPEMSARSMVSDRSLFAMLGFDELKSIDVSTYEHADILYDLNQDSLPQELAQSAQVVLDPGTIEHVFHLPNSLKNIFQMLQIGGRAIHIAPSSNHMDHGFYMFSPTLFFDYYTANQFDLQPMQIIQYKPQEVFRWKISPYAPGSFHPFSFGGLDEAMYAVYCIATKNRSSTHCKIPQQFHYEQNFWQQKPVLGPGSTLKKWIRKSTLLYKGALIFHKFYKRTRLRCRFEALKF